MSKLCTANLRNHKINPCHKLEHNRLKSSEHSFRNIFGRRSYKYRNIKDISGKPCGLCFQSNPSCIRGCKNLAQLDRTNLDRINNQIICLLNKAGSYKEAFCTPNRLHFERSGSWDILASKTHCRKQNLGCSSGSLRARYKASNWGHSSHIFL